VTLSRHREAFRKLLLQSSSVNSVFNGYLGNYSEVTLCYIIASAVSLGMRRDLLTGG
jgi:hypothetical protein